MAGEQHRLGRGARERYWGTPAAVLGVRQPGVWESGVRRIGGRAEHEDRAQIHVPRYLAQQRGEWPDPKQPNTEPLDLHRPAVDEVSWACAKCGKGVMHRVREVADCWFDSGAMPVAQWHYPLRIA